MYKIFKVEHRCSVILKKVLKHDFSQCSKRNQIIYKLGRYPSYAIFKNGFTYKRCLFSVNAPKHCLQTPVQHESEVENIGKGKVYFEFESNFHHRVLEDIDAYSNTIFKVDPSFKEKYRLSEEESKNILSSNWDSESAFNIAYGFISLGVYYSSESNTTMDDNKFDYLANAFIQKCSSFTDDQLIDCLIGLQSWPPADNVKGPNFLKVWKALDNVCYQRLIDWSVDKILFMMDLWFQIKLTRLSYFVYRGLNKISRKCDDLTTAQMIQALFYMSCARKLHPAIALREYEHYIQRYITDLSIEEIGIFALAFFKTEKKILNKKILIYMMQRVVGEVDSINPITLTAITKVIRLSHKPDIGFTSNDMVKKLVERRMDSLNLINAIHILHISTQIQFFNEEAITKLAEKFCSDPSSARLKDIERVAFIMSFFNFIPSSTPNILEIIMQQLDDPKHVTAGENHPLVLLSLVYFLTLLRTFPDKQIRHLLDEVSLKQKYNNRFMFPVQIVQIDYNRVLEGPPGSEHLLSPELREYLARRHSQYLPDMKHGKHNHIDQMFVEVIEYTKEVLGGEQYSLITYTLPHFHRADIVFHLDEDGRPLPIPEEMRARAPFVDMVRPPDTKGWYNVVIGGRNMYMHNVPKLLGEQVVKMRQLRLLGYTPIMIPYHYWIGEKDKAAFLKLKYLTQKQ